MGVENKLSIPVGYISSEVSSSFKCEATRVIEDKNCQTL